MTEVATEIPLAFYFHEITGGVFPDLIAFDRARGLWPAE
jgi:hypothetical protein